MFISRLHHSGWTFQFRSSARAEIKIGMNQIRNELLLIRIHVNKSTLISHFLTETENDPDCNSFWIYANTLKNNLAGSTTARIQPRLETLDLTLVTMTNILKLAVFSVV